MNQQEFEHWLKLQVEEQPFPPAEQEWLQIEQALKNQQMATKGLLFISLKSIAATVALLISVAAGFYFLFWQKDTASVSEADTTVAHIPNPLPQSNSSEPGQPVVPDNRMPATTTTYSPGSQTAIAAGQTLVVSSLPDKEEELVLVSPEASSPEVTTDAAVLSATPAPVFSLDEISAGDINIPRLRQGDKAVHFGITASVGTPNTGSIYYQLGIAGRRDFGRHVYIDAVLALASTEITYSSQHHFTGVKLEPDPGDISSSPTQPGSVTAITTVNPVTAGYGGHIVSVGIAPSLGFRITRHLSLSGGGYVYRNINTNLTLSNRTEINEEALFYDIIPEEEQVRNWDMGLRGMVEYRLNKAFSVNAGYTYGLSNYLANRQILFRNAGFNMGIRYMIGH